MRGWKIALGIAAGIVGLLVVAVILVVALFPEEKVRTIVVERAQSYVLRPVAVRHVGVAFWPSLGVDVEGVEVGNAPGLGPEPLFALDRLVVGVKIGSLIWSRRVKIDELILDRPRVVVRVDRQGRSSLDSLFAKGDTTKKAGKLPVDIVLDRLRLRNGYAAFHDAREDRDVVIGSINHDAALKVLRGGDFISADGTLRLGRVVASTKTMKVGPLDLALDHRVTADMAADSVAFRLASNIAGIALATDGRVHHMNTQPGVLADVRADTVDLATLVAHLPLPRKGKNKEIQASGQLSLDAHAHAIIDTTKGPIPLELHGTLVLRGIRIKYPDLPKAIDRIDGTIAFTQDTIAVIGLRVRAGRSQLALDALLRGWRGAEPMLVRSKLTGQVLLDELRDIIVLPEGTAVGGSVGIDLAASGPVRTPVNMDVRGTVALRDVRYTNPEILRAPLDVAGTIAVAPTAITVPGMAIRIGPSRINVDQASITDYLAFAMPAEKNPPIPHLTFTLRSPLFDVDRSIVLDTAAFKDTDVILPSGPFPRMAAEGTARIDRVVFYKVAMTGVQANVRMAGQRITTDGTMVVYGGTTGFNGWLDVSQAGNVHYAFQWDARGVQANDALTSLTTFENRLYGAAATTGSVTGRGIRYGDLKTNLAGEVTYRVGNGYLRNWPVVERVAGALEGGVNRVRAGWGSAAVQRMGITQDPIHFGTLVGRMAFQQGKMTIDSTQMDVAGQNWGINGTVSFQGAMDLRARLTFAQDLTLELAQGAAGAVSRLVPVTPQSLAGALVPPNRLQVALPIRGTFRAPNVGAPDLLHPFELAARNAATTEARSLESRAIEQAKQRLHGIFGR